MKGQWCCFYVLEFDDRVEGQKLHVGTKNDCDMVADRIPAVTYSGRGEVKDSNMYVAPLGEMSNELKAALGIKEDTK
jgi:hypothetical protein